MSIRSALPRIAATREEPARRAVSIAAHARQADQGGGHFRASAYPADEFNTAFAGQYQSAAVNQNAWLSKFSEFRIAVERYLTQLHDVQGSAAKLALNPSSLYGIVKEFAGISPREWITNRLMLEARRRLQDSTTEVKEPAYDPGVSDPGYFSRLFRKHSGISVTKYPAEPRDLSRN